ncbi:GMC oxidoreductase [Streptomyces sp. NPDC050560]|uniref:GMC oxidoreductase n=1 Tax=Streptomyces sp. NPDC050560 TaxID=3365630 RepID=UPI00378DC511
MRAPAVLGTVVVGAGLAGLAVAAEMDRAGCGDGTVVLEAGPDDGAAHNRWAYDETAAVRRWLHPEEDAYAWRPWTARGSGFSDAAALRSRVGGRSLYWHGVLLPIEPWALADPSWPREVVHDLVDSWDGGACLYDRVTAELADWAGTESTGVSAAPVLRIGSLSFREVLKAVRRHPGDPGRWRAYTPLERWVGDTCAPPAARIRPGSRVVGVLLDGDEVAGVRVRCDGVDSDVRCRQVVLAAGAVENARLAIQTLSEAGRRTAAELPGPVDKIDQGFTVACAADQLPGEVAEMAKRGALLVSPCAEGLRSNLFLDLRRNMAGGVVIMASTMGEQRLAEAGRVRCRPGRSWPWPVEVSARPGRADRALAREQRAVLERTWRELRGYLRLPGPARVFESRRVGPRTGDGLTALDHATGAAGPAPFALPHGSQHHDAGTTPFGTLLDADQQFHGVRGLYAAGPSTFPRTGAANPSLTTLALARRLAARLAPGTARNAPAGP